MRAIVQDRYGSTDQLRLAEVPDPRARPRRGARPGRRGRRRPRHLARHGRAGRSPPASPSVCARRGTARRAVTSPAPSRPSARASPATPWGMPCTAPPAGSFAELAVVPLTRLARRPANLSVEEAAAVPVSALTALQALRAGRVEAGDRVLVIGASGGVGSYAVQLAVDLGAHVTGVCGPAKADLVRSLGAEQVVDHTTTPLDTLDERFDVVLDIAGHRPVRLLRGLLTERGCPGHRGQRERGRWLGGLQRSIGAALLSPFVRQRLVMLMASEDGADLADAHRGHRARGRAPGAGAHLHARGGRRGDRPRRGGHVPAARSSSRWPPEPPTRAPLRRECARGRQGDHAAHSTRHSRRRSGHRTTRRGSWTPEDALPTDSGAPRHPPRPGGRAGLDERQARHGRSRTHPAHDPAAVDPRRARDGAAHRHPRRRGRGRGP